MNNVIENEYLNVKNLISGEEFLDKCEKLHHRLGLSAKDHSKLWKPYDGHLYFHDKNDFPIKDLYDQTCDKFPLNENDISKILSKSIMNNIDLIDENCQYAIIYNREKFMGENVEFIKKCKIYDFKLIDKFKEELLDYTLDFCRDGAILNDFNKNFDDFDSISDLLNFLNNIKDKFPSLNWSLNYYDKFKEDFNTVKEFYVMVVEFDFQYKFTACEISPLDPFFDYLMNEFTNDLFKQYHDSYDFWDQYGSTSYHI